MLNLLIFSATCLFLISCSRKETTDDNKQSPVPSSDKNSPSAPDNIKKNPTSFQNGSPSQRIKQLENGQSSAIEKNQKGDSSPGIIFKTVNLDEFNRYKNLSTKPVIAIISADDCPPCENLKKDIFSMHDFSGKAEFIELKVQDKKSDKFVKKLGVKFYPTLLMLKGGSERSRWVGYGENIAAEVQKRIHDFLKEGRK